MSQLLFRKVSCQRGNPEASVWVPYSVYQHPARCFRRSRIFPSQPVGRVEGRAAEVGLELKRAGFAILTPQITQKEAWRWNR